MDETLSIPTASGIGVAVQTCCKTTLVQSGVLWTSLVGRVLRHPVTMVNKMPVISRCNTNTNGAYSASITTAKITTLYRVCDYHRLHYPCDRTSLYHKYTCPVQYSPSWLITSLGRVYTPRSGGSFALDYLQIVCNTTRSAPKTTSVVFCVCPNRSIGFKGGLNCESATRLWRVFQILVGLIPTSFPGLDHKLPLCTLLVRSLFGARLGLRTQRH